MADEEVVEEEQAEEELEDGDAESDLDSLMSEVEAKESAEDSGVGGDLSSLVSDSSEEKSQDLDSMLSSAQQVSISEDQEEEGMSLDLLLVSRLLGNQFRRKIIIVGLESPVLLIHESGSGSSVRGGSADLVHPAHAFDPFFGRDDFCQPGAEFFVDDHHFSTGDEAVVDKQI